MICNGWTSLPLESPWCHLICKFKRDVHRSGAKVSFASFDRPFWCLLSTSFQASVQEHQGSWTKADKFRLRARQVSKLNDSAVVFALSNFVQTSWVPTGAPFGQRFQRCLGGSEANWHPVFFSRFRQVKLEPRSLRRSLSSTSHLGHP